MELLPLSVRAGLPSKWINDIIFQEVTEMATDYGKVVVTDIKIPFGSMVVLMVKWAVATIPALVILGVIGSIAFSIISAFLSGWHMKIWSL
jgi:hypothetical protein